MLFRLRPILLTALAVAAPMSVAWTAEGRSQARVISVQPARAADLIMLDAGFDAGLRMGMVCRVKRGTTEIAEVLLVDIRASHSAALIASNMPRQSIRPGDSVSVKTLKS